MKSNKNTDTAQIKKLFNATFSEKYQVELRSGKDEPIYQAAKSPGEINYLFSKENFIRSALHEIAHWSIAGPERRSLDDFGYWYKPDGRGLQEQIEFENFEIKPQAIEKAFCEALEIPFQVSTDNLDLPEYDTKSFEEKVTSQLNIYRKNGFPKRASLFLSGLRKLTESKF